MIDEELGAVLVVRCSMKLKRRIRQYISDHGGDQSEFVRSAILEKLERTIPLKITEFEALPLVLPKHEETEQIKVDWNSLTLEQLEQYSKSIDYSERIMASQILKIRRPPEK